MTAKKLLKKSTNAPAKKVQKLTRGVIKTAAGVAVTNPKEFIKIIAHSGDQLLKGEFSQALHDTYAFFVNQGKIDPKYFDTVEFADLAPEFGKVYNGSYDIEQLNTLRRMFANMALDRGPDSHKKYLIEIALEMTGPEIKVLIAENLLSEQVTDPADVREYAQAHRWLKGSAKLSGLKHASLVERAEDDLIRKKLISDRQYSDRSGTAFAMHQGRLTTLGMEMVEMMTLEDDPITT